MGFELHGEDIDERDRRLEEQKASSGDLADDLLADKSPVGDVLSLKRPEDVTEDVMTAWWKFAERGKDRVQARGGKKERDVFIREELEKDSGFVKVMESTKKDFVAAWEKFMKSKKGQEYKEGHPEIFAKYDDPNAVARYVAEKEAYRLGAKVFIHNQLVTDNPWKYGFKVNEDSIVDLCKDHVGVLEDRIVALPVGEYVTKDVEYDYTAKVTEVEGKWRSGDFMNSIIFQIQTLGEERMAEASLLRDFPGGMMMVSFNSGVRGDNRFVIFSFQRPGKEVHNYEFNLPKDPDKTKFVAMYNALRDIAKKAEKI